MALAASDVTDAREQILGEIEGKTLLTTFREASERWADEPAMGWKQGGEWRTLNWHEYREQVLDVASGMRALGFRRGEFALVMSRNRPEALLAELAILHARGVPVHLYNTLPPDQIAYIATHCDATFAFLDEGLPEKFATIRSQLPRLQRAVTFGPGALDGWETGWSEAMAMGRQANEQDRSWVEAATDEVAAEDLLTMIYTSGTTGPPKGVMHTHRWALYMLNAWYSLVPPSPKGRVISHLPLAHGAARILDLWTPMLVGNTVYFCPDLGQLAECLTEIRPTMFFSAPRVWEKLHSALLTGVARMPDVASKEAVERSIEAGREVVRLRQRGETASTAQLTEYERAEPIRRSMLAKVGLDACQQALSGAAPIDPGLIEFFQALGLPFSELWGLTEIGVVTGSEFGSVRNGTVGHAFPGVELKRVADGEILVRTAISMNGYFRDPSGTAEAIDRDGWLHTGDVGELDADGYLRIVDRKKELIITSGGKNISPANIEHLLARHPLIGQAMAIGDRRNYITALLVLDPVTAPIWAEQHGLRSGSLDELARDGTILAEVQEGVDDANIRLARVEQVKKWTLLSEVWTPDTGELTPTLKLKRRVVVEKHTAKIEAMYSA